MPQAVLFASWNNAIFSAYGPRSFHRHAVCLQQNFGAACRSAYFLGAAGVVTCTRNSAALTGVVSKASAGSLEVFSRQSCLSLSGAQWHCSESSLLQVMPVHSARNLPATLQAAQNAGWQVLGAAADPGAIACGEAYLIGPTIIVVGSEGFGLRYTSHPVLWAASRALLPDNGPQASTYCLQDQYQALLFQAGASDRPAPQGRPCPTGQPECVCCHGHPLASVADLSTIYKIIGKSDST